MHLRQIGIGLTLMLLAPVRLAGAQASPDSAVRLVLTGVTVVDGTGRPPRPNQSVLIEGERIAAIFPAGSRPLPPGARVHDLTGRYLIPGLIDTHVHVATDPSGEDSRVRTERRLRGALLGGVTAVRDMAGDVRALASLQRDALVGEIAGPDIYYAALFAGPSFFADPRTHDAARGLMPGQVPWMRAITDTTDVRQAVSEARGTGATAIKLYADLSGELARRITAEAHRQGLAVWAHAALRPARPIEVVEANVDAVSHSTLVALAMDSARYARAAGALADAPLDLKDAGLDALFAAMVRRRTTFEPTLLVFEDSPPVLRLAGAIARAAHRRGVTIVAGTDTLGSADPGPLALPNLHRELELLVTLAGLSPAEALESATRNAAEVLGAGRLRGTVEVGKLADLVVLRADPLLDIRHTRSIELVVKRGQVFRTTGAVAARQPGFSAPAREARLRAALPAVDSIMREFTRREHVPGTAWAVVMDDRVVHTGVEGLRDLETKSPVDSATVFRIASMTKSFTAMAIMRLRDEGKLSLDDPAEKYVPELKSLAYPTSDAPKITIRHLLSHATGFPEDNPWGDQQLSRTDAELSAMMKKGIPFSNPPGVSYEYSNYGFAILGRIVTRASGTPYNDYLARYILKPLGMRSTTLSPTSVPADRLAHGYRWEDERWKEEPQLPDGSFGPMGGMLTSLSDLGRYVSAFLGSWPPRSGPDTGPVRRASLREMQQVWRHDAPSVVRDSMGLRLSAGGYGFGLRVSSDCRFAHIVGHSGGLPGFGSRMQWLPEYGIGIIAFGNRTYTPWGPPVAAALAMLKERAELKPREPAPAKALVAARERVTRLVLDWDDGLARSVAAENLFLDRSLDRRRAEVVELREKVGKCSPASGFAYVENALRGRWVLPCERGDLVVSVTLAPTMPALVQFLEVTAAPPAGEVGPPPRCP